MPRIDQAEQAREDLIEIWNYFDDATIAAARKFGIRSDCWIMESHKVTDP